MPGKSKFITAAGVVLIGAALLLSVYNIKEEKDAKESAEHVIAELTETPVEEWESFGTEGEDEVPLYVQYPDMEMPVKEAGGDFYIGILSVPAAELLLPVMSEWSYPALKKSPCRYVGSVYKKNLVIAGHNYRSHFSPIKRLALGETVIFTDMDGNQFFYEASSAEILRPNQREDLIAGEWDLTLFTCTYGGSERFALRCTLVREEPNRE